MTPFERDIYRKINYLQQQLQCLKQKVCCGDCCNGCGKCGQDYCTDLRIGNDLENTWAVRTLLTDDEWLISNDLSNHISNIRFNVDLLREEICRTGEECGFAGTINNIFNRRIDGTIKFRWGYRVGFSNTNLRTHATPMGTVYEYRLEYHIPFWNEIKDFQPVLLIDRYKANVKKLDNIGNTIGRKYKYAHEDPQIALSNGRSSEVPINSERAFLDFGQINYFNFNGTHPKGKGMNGNFANANMWRNKGIGGSVYLGFRLRLNDNGSIFETGHLGYLRMQIIKKGFRTLNERIFLTYKIQ